MHTNREVARIFSSAEASGSSPLRYAYQEGASMTSLQVSQVFGTASRECWLRRGI